MAKNVDPAVLQLIKELNPAVADDIERARYINKGQTYAAEIPEDAIAFDYGELLAFEHNGVKLNAEELDFVASYIGRGFAPSRGLKSGEIAEMVIRLQVIMALKKMTEGAIRQYQVNPAKGMRELGNVLDGRQYR